MGGCFNIVENEPRFVILTVPADACVSQVHHRMPLIFEPSQILPWLCDHRFAQTMLERSVSGLSVQDSRLERHQDYEQLSLF